MSSAARFSLRTSALKRRTPPHGRAGIVGRAQEAAVAQVGAESLHPRRQLRAVVRPDGTDFDPGSVAKLGEHAA